MSEHAKLYWRCRRGMKELDFLMLRYLEQTYGGASADEQRIFRELLELQDPDLFAYLIGRSIPADPAVADVVRKIASGTAA